MTQDDSFTLDESITAQKALRSALGLPEEVFPVEAENHGCASGLRPTLVSSSARIS
jgi:hypothetical protein